jgi:replicative superfamily II helicase
MASTEDALSLSSDEDSTAEQIRLMEKKLEQRRRKQAEEESDSCSSEEDPIPDKHPLRFTMQRKGSSFSSSDSDRDNGIPSGVRRKPPSNFSRPPASCTGLTPPPISTAVAGQASNPTKDFSPHPSSEVSLTPPPPARSVVRNQAMPARKTTITGGAETSPISLGSSSDSSFSETETPTAKKPTSYPIANYSGGASSTKKPVHNPYAKKNATGTTIRVNPYSKTKAMVQRSPGLSGTSPHITAAAAAATATTTKTAPPGSAQAMTSNRSVPTTPKPPPQPQQSLVDQVPRQKDSNASLSSDSSSNSSSSGSSESESSLSDAGLSLPSPEMSSQRPGADRTHTGAAKCGNEQQGSMETHPSKAGKANTAAMGNDYLDLFDLDSDDDMEHSDFKSSFFSSPNERTNTTETAPIHTQPSRRGSVACASKHVDFTSYPIPIDELEMQESEGVRIVDFAAQNDERTLEIDPALYAPPSYKPMPEPMVHSFNLRNRPMQVRQQTPVAHVFPSPINQLWKSKFKNFNHLQSEVANVLANTNDNFLVSSPTGSGKSTIFDIAMARLLLQDLQTQSNPNNQRLPVISRHRKMVYVAPSKALCEERFDDWSRRLSELKLGIEVAMITGDGEVGEGYRDLASAHFIVTTPEKFDSLSRRWTENFYLFASIKLFMVDEVHLLGDPSRGWCLETIICRIKTIQRAASNASVTQSDLLSSSYPHTTPEAIASSLRIVAVSATLPNIQDCAALISAAECYAFDQSYRPVPLKTHVQGFGYIGKNAFRFWQNLDHRVPELIQRFSDGKPAIVFCHSKKETEKLADTLAQSRGIGGNPTEARRKIALQTRVRGLQRVLTYGIAYHHAGLDLQDRRLIEKGFSDGTIRVLCATSTLAMGVNLPVHLVVIKGTMAWRGSGSGYQDLDAATILQMTGRAGRPGYDTSGTAVIMCDNQSKKRIEQLSNGLGPAESQLESKLVEVVNSEISQSVIFSTQSALDWIKDTLYFIRVKRNFKGNSDQIDRFLLDKLEGSIRKLKDMGFVGENAKYELHPLPASLVMAKNLVNMQSCELMAGLPADASMCQVLTVICQIEDLQRPVRRYEKSKLNEAQKDIKYKLDGPPSKVRVQTPFQKAFVLLQAAIGQVYFEDYTLRQEMNSMIEYASRMLTALEQYSARGKIKLFRSGKNKTPSFLRPRSHSSPRRG